VAEQCVTEGVAPKTGALTTFGFSLQQLEGLHHLPLVGCGELEAGAIRTDGLDPYGSIGEGVLQASADAGQPLARVDGAWEEALRQRLEPNHLALWDPQRVRLLLHRERIRRGEAGIHQHDAGALEQLPRVALGVGTVSPLDHDLFLWLASEQLGDPVEGTAIAGRMDDVLPDQRGINGLAECGS
jgi:hypothetical protein